MRRLSVCLIALCVPASLAAAQATITPDSYEPAPEPRPLVSRALAMATLTDSPGPLLLDPPDISALGLEDGPIFSPRVQFVVRAVPRSENAPTGGAPVPAPSALALLGLAGLVASRRRVR